MFSRITSRFVVIIIRRSIMVNVTELVNAARKRGYRVSSKIDSANNSDYSILKKDGNTFPLRYVDANRTGGIRHHVGGLMMEFPGTADELLDWYEGEVAKGRSKVDIAEYVEPRLGEFDNIDVLK